MLSAKRFFIAYEGLYRSGQEAAICALINVDGPRRERRSANYFATRRDRSWTKRVSYVGRLDMPTLNALIVQYFLAPPREYVQSDGFVATKAWAGIAIASSEALRDIKRATGDALQKLENDTDLWELELPCMSKLYIVESEGRWKTVIQERGLVVIDAEAAGSVPDKLYRGKRK